jgi:hypothetical protein
MSRANYPPTLKYFGLFIFQFGGKRFGNMADRTEMREMKATNLFKVALHLDCGGCREKN